MFIIPFDFSYFFLHFFLASLAFTQKLFHRSFFIRFFQLHKTLSFPPSNNFLRRVNDEGNQKKSQRKKKFSVNSFSYEKKFLNFLLTSGEKLYHSKYSYLHFYSHSHMVTNQKVSIPIESTYVCISVVKADAQITLCYGNLFRSWLAH